MRSEAWCDPRLAVRASGPSEKVGWYAECRAGFCETLIECGENQPFVHDDREMQGIARSQAQLRLISGSRSRSKRRFSHRHHSERGRRQLCERGKRHGAQRSIDGARSNLDRKRRREFRRDPSTDGKIAGRLRGESFLYPCRPRPSGQRCDQDRRVEIEHQ